MSATGPILDVQHLSMRFGGIVAVNDLSFEAKRGDITALIGPNGAGKTTVFNCITGFYKPTTGMLRLTHEDGRAFLLERLLSDQPEPRFELVECVEQRPPAVTWQQHDCVTYALDHHFITLETKFLGKTHRLASAIDEELCSVHGILLCLESTISIYLFGVGSGF